MNLFLVLVGDVLGDAVGIAVGDSVGDMLGVAVGVTEGAAVGGTVQTPQCAWHDAAAAGHPRNPTMTTQPSGSGP